MKCENFLSIFKTKAEFVGAHARIENHAIPHCTCSHLMFCISHTCAVALPYSGPYFNLHSESDHLDSGMKVTDFNSSLVHST